MRPDDKNNTERFIVLTLSFREEDGIGLARCVELGTSTFGNTFEEAREALHEAIELHLNTLEDVKECELFLKENGVRIYQSPPRSNTALRKVGIKPGEYVSRDITRITNPTMC